MPINETLHQQRTEHHRIVVVDDTTSNRQLYSKLLTLAGYQVRCAATGSESLRLIAEEKPDLVLLDYMMPGMNGVEVLQHLRSGSATRDVPVIILTASVSTEDIGNALGSGANDYISKPVDSRILLTRIRSIIRAREDRMAAEQPKHDRLKRELAEAQEVQRAQLPAVPLAWRGWSITGSVVPSGNVAGDVFDIVPTDDGRCICLLIDVSGHGAAAALVAAETRVGLRDLVRRGQIRKAFATLNEQLVKGATGKYACVAAVELTPNGGTVINAGLPPVVLLRDGKVMQSVVASGLPVGMFSGADYESTQLQPQPGDTIAMVSDGLTEPFGAADDVAGALARICLSTDLKAPCSASPEQIEERVKTSRVNLTPDRKDDATLVLMDLWE